jgi:hypothetical protein
MSTTFTINFRREAYRRQVARMRARVVTLAAWLAYFGVLAVVLGLYALNAVAFQRRVVQLERQVERDRARGQDHEPPALSEADARQLERYVASIVGQRDRLRRLGQLLPPGVRVTQLQLNPENLSGIGPHKLVIAGVLRSSAADDRMRGVMGLVTTLQEDSVFRRGISNVRLTSTTATEGAGTEFVIECR